MFISPPPPPPITIMVHGTRPSCVLPFLSVHATVQTIVDASIPEPNGLQALHELGQKGKTYALLKALSMANPEQFPEQSMYSFGWSGDLDGEVRKQAAKQLFESIAALVVHYKQVYGSAPPITLISHSHGGNVILYMALFDKNQHLFQIDRTILLAIPVQKETAHFVNHSLFGTVYSIHSHMDMIQIMDPQRLYPYKQAFALCQETKSFNPLKQAYLNGLTHPFFSERHFPTANNLIQASIYWKPVPKKPSPTLPTYKIESWLASFTNRIINQKRGVLHTEFVTPSFISQLPYILQQLDKYKLANDAISNDIEIII